MSVSLIIFVFGHQETGTTCGYHQLYTACSCLSGLQFQPIFDPITVVSWQEECAMRQCDAYPNWHLLIPEGRNEEVVTLALWGDKFCPIKGKKVKTGHVSSITSILL